MIARHKAELLNALDHLITYGWVHVRRDILVKRWFGQERLTKGIWRAIIENLPEDWESEHVAVFEWGDDIIILEKDQIKKIDDLL